jgi:hypothetical protein
VFSGHGLEGGYGRVGPGQEFVEAAIRMARDDAGDHVREVGLRLDADELAGLDQGRNDGPMLGACVGSGEERVLAGERERADGALDDIGVDLVASVLEEQP